MDDMTQLLTLADRGAFVADLARFDPAGLIPADAPRQEVASLAVGPILCSPAVSAADVEASLVRAQELAQAEIARLNGLLAEAPRDELAASLAFARSRVRALGRALDYLSRAAKKGAMLAAQTPSGAWMVVGSKGDRYRLDRQGLMLVCGCEHGEKLRRGEAAAGQCWHLEIIFGIEEAQDERYGLAA